ncbi:YigZ family protein [Aerococcus agrisoli]|uniref:YigZ family protein n=1 Tax=Aerococcus agrisoli TaxID=2487350 RepID=A0A3N4GVJ3_9LACT|nr:YigZ family protein [Aerococcus agrisoli]RPA65467.1 YigZ family protein [Aerococcus agrisoli]
MIEYRTVVAQGGTHEIDVKGSRFICNAKRVFSEAEAIEFIEAIRKEHYKATHNCVAFQIGDNNEIQRALDDGEPSGTAGVPMLEVLKQRDLKNIVVVVTRYFGGTKLGSGGLIRAYSSAVSEGLDTIGQVERKLQTQLAIEVAYTLSGKVEHWIEESTYQLLDTSYLADVTFHLGIPTNELDKVQNSLINLTSGQVKFEIGDEIYVDLPINA